jgi:DNA-binding NarL/FixJ family response regulator
MTYVMIPMPASFHRRWFRWQRAEYLRQKRAKFGTPARPALRPEDEKVLVQAILDQKSYKEIAAQLSISVWTVKARLSVLYSKHHIEGRWKRIKFFNFLAKNGVSSYAKD